MDVDRFVVNIKKKDAKTIVNKIKIICEEKNYDINIILYEYFEFFKNSKTKKETEEILNDIANNYGTLKNKLNIKEYNLLEYKIKKEISPINIEEGETKCPKCHEKKVLHSKAQTRSMDEPETMFYTCINAKCRFKWKRNG